MKSFSDCDSSLTWARIALVFRWTTDELHEEGAVLGGCAGTLWPS